MKHSLGNDAFSWGNDAFPGIYATLESGIDLRHVRSRRRLASIEKSARRVPDLGRIVRAAFGVRSAGFSRCTGRYRSPRDRWRQLPGADADRRRQVAMLPVAILAAPGLRHRRVAFDCADARP